MTALRQTLKRFVFDLLGKDPEAVVVSFVSGPEPAAREMVSEVRRLVPGRRHFVVCVNTPVDIAGTTTITLAPGGPWRLYRQLQRQFRALRIGQAPVLVTADGAQAPLRWAAFLLAPRKILAYNSRLERHHLRLRTLVASCLFLRGVPLDRIFLRPLWLCPWKRDRSVVPAEYRVCDGRPLSPLRRRVAVLTPYVPYPLSHGGAVRMFNLLRRASADFDIFLFAFEERRQPENDEPLLQFCARLTLVAKPRYREPRWSSLRPPEVCEYESPVMRRLLDEARSQDGAELLQVEYTQLAAYRGDVLVEHDVTFDLYRQVHDAHRSLPSRWDLARWIRFERPALRRCLRVVAMSDKDAGMIALPSVRVIPNGVDLDRFRPVTERPGQQLLFIGSFRHFPNILAYRFFTEQVWPLLAERFPAMTLTAVAGPDPLLYWRASQDLAAPARDSRIRLLEFVEDVRPLYCGANLVIVPTLVSAGTNVKVIEAMAMERAVVSTPSGCAGLGLTHGENVWIAGDAAGFAGGIARLIEDDGLRREIARSARSLAETNFDWKRLGELQSALWTELLPQPIRVRPAGPADIARIAEIQAASPEAAAWKPESYLDYECLVTDQDGRTAGFIAARQVAEGEYEILNLAVALEFRRRGVASRLLGAVLRNYRGTYFLEVRASNTAARNLYRRCGFREAGIRPRYYESPSEDGIVMRL